MLEDKCNIKFKELVPSWKDKEFKDKMQLGYKLKDKGRDKLKFREGNNMKEILQIKGDCRPKPKPEKKLKWIDWPKSSNNKRKYNGKENSYSIKKKCIK